MGELMLEPVILQRYPLQKRGIRTPMLRAKQKPQPQIERQ